MSTSGGKTSAELKAFARGTILSCLPVCIGANLIYSLVRFLLDNIVAGVLTDASVLSFVMNIALSFLSAVFMGIFQAGLCLIYLKLIFGQPASVRDLFHCFRESPDRVVRLQAVISALQLAGLLPVQIYMSFFSRGSVLSLAELLSQDRTALVGMAVRFGTLSLIGTVIQFAVSLFLGLSCYILLDFPELGTVEILQRSIRLMRGAKGKLLYITLSFIPLYLIGFISFGIANLWVMAYEQAVLAAFYKDRLEAAGRTEV
ncbi:MAG: DUF975 family protein [Lachnospiraceae bacterium]|nr:DUF975 family protein [Lachnospiraceae bacterium]